MQMSMISSSSSSSSVSSVEAGLPPGFRFHPKDEELVTEYLLRWVRGCPHPHPCPSFLRLDLNSTEPWDLPAESACVGNKEWYFYSQRDRKYATGLRTNRATLSGYWKATGKDRPVYDNKTLVGMRKTLVFYKGRAPKGRKTEWVMHEFRLDRPDPNKTSAAAPPVMVEEWVLCRVFSKNRRDQSPPGHQSSYYPHFPCFSTLNIGSQTNPNLGTQRQQLPPPPLPGDLHGQLLVPDRLEVIPYNNNYDGYFCRYDSTTSLEMTTMKGDVRPAAAAAAAGGESPEGVRSDPPMSLVEVGGSFDGSFNYLSSEVGLLSSLWNF